MAAAIPLGLLWTPEDVALATLFLASKSSAWITGVTLPICREAGSWSDPKSSMRYSTACKSISDLDRRVYEGSNQRTGETRRGLGRR